MKRSLAILLCGRALTACTTLGAGTGSLESDHEPVSFAWKSKDGGTTGTMTATLADGEVFSGPYLQVTSDARTEDFAPMWNSGNYGWPVWTWGASPPLEPVTSFATLYSGRVMATLQSGDGERMRCHFQLNNPGAGMPGGGQGDCQLEDGGTVDALFPKA